MLSVSMTYGEDSGVDGLGACLWLVSIPQDLPLLAKGVTSAFFLAPTLPNPCCHLLSSPNRRGVLRKGCQGKRKPGNEWGGWKETLAPHSLAGFL